MSNIRCGNCGFLNFALDLSCKRCKATFGELPPPEIQQPFGGLQPAFQPEYQNGYQAEPWPQPVYQPFNPYNLPAPVAPLPKVSKNGSTNAGLWILLSLTVAVAFGIGALWKFGRPTPTVTGWQEFRSQDNSYTVQMPVKASEIVQNQPTPAGDVQMHMAMGLMGDKGVYMVAYGDYPISANRLPASDLLNAGATGAVANSGSTEVSRKNITIDGYQGVEVEVSIPATKLPGGGRAVIRMYWASPRLYMLFVGGQDSSGVYESRAKFLDSFRILKVRT